MDKLTDILKFKEKNPEMDRVMENIAEVEANIQQRLFDLGKLFYVKYKNDKTIDPEFCAHIDILNKLQENRKGFYANKLRIEGKMMCENCGAIIPYGSVFCSSCGKKAAEKEAGSSESTVPEKDVKRCPKCGAEVEDDASFCVACGSPVK